ncbi:MAG: M1 family aminopeptidase, partial [Gemmatimonadales bacterium]
DLEVDAASWEDGSAATTFKGREHSILWVRAGNVGATTRLHLRYHGDLIDRFGDFFYINSSVAWYPHALDVRNRATFDLTFHSPTSYVLASVGQLVDSTVADRTLTTRWVSEAPIRNASFNLGLFEPYDVREADGPVVTVLWSDEAQRALRRILPQGRGVQRAVGEDVSKSLQFFQTMFGRATTDRFYATEIPYGHGEAFPGLVHLSWITFQGLDDEGQDEIFRAHEAAHQWWGIGVDFASYHDQWLSEGLAQFSGLWYLQTARRDNEKYFNALREWRRDLLDHREVALDREHDLAPIWMGHRASSSTAPDDYSLVVYLKGAWVVHMLRLLMLDLRTMNEDAFAAMLRDFYTTYRGQQVTTGDFQRVVEQHMRMPMDWFFDQWVYGSAIPTYHVAHRSDRMPDGRYQVTVRVRQEGVPEDFRMWVPVSVDLGGDRWARLRVEVAASVSEIELPPMPSEPRGIRFNELEAVLAEVKTERW